VSVLSRRVASVPTRTSSDTWRVIIDLLARPDEPARAQLDAVTGIAALLVAEEYTAQAPIVVQPASGDRVHIYTVHGEAALEAEPSEQPLANWPLAVPGWTISLPSAEADLVDIGAALADHGGFTVRDLNEGLQVSSAPTRTRLVVNREEVKRA
jgi:hypothetical protein